jgi:hypothetical protein
LRLLELFFDDEPEALDRFLELADRLREEADLDDDFFVAGIFDFSSLSKWQANSCAARYSRFYSVRRERNG